MLINLKTMLSKQRVLSEPIVWEQSRVQNACYNILKNDHFYNPKKATYCAVLARKFDQETNNRLVTFM